jgi:hypothetical protein
VAIRNSGPESRIFAILRCLKRLQNCGTKELRYSKCETKKRIILYDVIPQSGRVTVTVWIVIHSYGDKIVLGAVALLLKKWKRCHIANEELPHSEVYCLQIAEVLLQIVVKKILEEWNGSADVNRGFAIADCGKTTFCRMEKQHVLLTKPNQTWASIDLSVLFGSWRSLPWYSGWCTLLVNFSART